MGALHISMKMRWIGRGGLMRLRLAPPRAFLPVAVVASDRAGQRDAYAAVLPASRCLGLARLWSTSDWRITATRGRRGPLPSALT